MISDQDFNGRLSALRDFSGERILAAAVSGGPDSMALLWLLSRWAAPRGIEVIAYTVDHGLRAEAADEAKSVAGWVENWPAVKHRILIWRGEKPDSRILEEARNARYALLQKAMVEEGAKYLFVAHHRDDQAETFLTRLAKGSGLDGLAGMSALQQKGDIDLVRPLLDAGKDELIATCAENAVSYIDDPTNTNEAYLRPRLRAVSLVLEQEGLSAKRLALTAKRIGRARAALDDLAHSLFSDALKEQRRDGFLFDLKVLHGAPEELVLRLIMKAVNKLRPEADYNPRLEKLENLLGRLLGDDTFKGATLGGCLFAKNIKDGTLWIGKE